MAGSWSRAGSGKAEDQERSPIPKLHNDKKDKKIRSPDMEIWLFLPIKESEITDSFLGASLKDEVSETLAVQKQTRADQVQGFKVLVAIRDYVGLGVQCSKEVATAVCGTIIEVKLSISPMWRGSRGSKTGQPHSVSCKVTGRCDSGLVRLIPNTRGTGSVSAPVPKKLLMMAPIDNGYPSAGGAVPTLGNFAKTCSDAIPKTYSSLTPDLWNETMFTKSPSSGIHRHL